MFDRLFRRKPAPQILPPSTGERLVYAVGDVHGRLDALAPLLHDIARDALAAMPTTPPLLVFLGDYVDRGPDSRRVVEMIMALAADGAFEVVALKGNHEATLLEFLADPMLGPPWMEFGGSATLASYGVEHHPGAIDEETWAEVRHAFEAALPEAHLGFFQRLELMRVVGDYAFVHAGVRPGVALEAQVEEDLIWIRQDFLNAREPFGKVVVHGHTPVEAPERLPNRLNLDTGAYATGVLTAIRLKGQDQRLMQSRAQH